MAKTMSNAPIFQRGGRLMFGQVREDAAVDLFLVAQLQSPSRLFVIASGGCTALSLLSTGCAVDALDISGAQIALVELKWRMFQHLGFEETATACSKSLGNRMELVRSTISPDSWNSLLENSVATASDLNNSGWVDQRMKQLRQVFYILVHSRAATESFLSMCDETEQLLFYENDWSNWQWRNSLRIAFSRAFLRVLHGPSAWQLVPADFSTTMALRLRNALTRSPNNANPYIWQALLGKYNDADNAVPPYLQPVRWPALAANLSNLNLVCDDTVGWLQSQSEKSFDYLGLSNILELLPPSYAQALEAELVRCAKPNALVCVRAIFPRTTPVFSQTSFQGRALIYDEKLSAQAEIQDRSLFCNFYQVYRCSETPLAS